MRPILLLIFRRSFFQNGLRMEYTLKGDKVVHFQNLPGADTVQVYLRVISVSEVCEFEESGSLG